MLLSQAVEEFLLSMQADGRSEATVKWYGSALRSFARAHSGLLVTDLRAPSLRSYIVGLRDREAYSEAPQKPAQGHKVAVSTVDSYVTALRTFWAWCAREYKFENPMINIRRAPARSPNVKAIDPKDFVRLFHATGDGVAGTRDRALLAFLADTGCRLGGLTGLKLEDLDMHTRTAIVREKGNKTRRVVFTIVTARLLVAWLSLRVSETPYVFTALVYPRERLAHNGVEQILLRLKRKAGVNGRVNPHSFRHRFAIAYVQNGGDLMSLAKLMGDDIKTVSDYYGIFTQDELSQLHEKYSPLKGMLGEIP